MIEIIVIIYNDEEGGNADENNDGDVTKETKVQSGRCLKSGIPLYIKALENLAPHQISFYGLEREWEGFRLCRLE